MLNECVPVVARTKRFPLRKGKSTVIAERKQFPLILDHVITVHKSQGSTLAYMQGDLSKTARKLQQGRSINNLHLRVSFIPYFPVPKS